MERLMEAGGAANQARCMGWATVFVAALHTSRDDLRSPKILSPVGGVRPGCGGKPQKTRHKATARFPGKTAEPGRIFVQKLIGGSGGVESFAQRVGNGCFAQGVDGAAQ